MFMQHVLGTSTVLCNILKITNEYDTDNTLLVGVYVPIITKSK